MLTPIFVAQTSLAFTGMVAVAIPTMLVSLTSQCHFLLMLLECWNLILLPVSLFIWRIRLDLEIQCDGTIRQLSPYKSCSETPPNSVLGQRVMSVLLVLRIQREWRST